ncbi:MAG: phage integrase N-terminal domain-containing protein [Thalassospira sp.]|uniref:phage integrase N-terminal domain-containing protein n=1 Tax=Thalassospira sp. TaxID=1912094 RepID=UPI003A8B20D6
MRALNFELMKLNQKNRDGSYATRDARSRILAQAANELHDLGYRGLKARGLKSKHVEALVRQWQEQELSIGTIKNRMAHIRWWAEKVGKPGVVRKDNEAYGIMKRTYVTNDDKSRRLGAIVHQVRDPYVAMSLRLQEAFGFRREEAIKFQPTYADRGNVVCLKETWTKGGKARDVPVVNAQQRTVLDEARLLAGRGSLIAPDRTYVQQLRIYEANTSAVGLSRMHGLRHAYAQDRYQTLTGWSCPAVGGPRRRTLAGPMVDEDRQARLQISRELGHERLEVVAVYLGS